ncbi:Acyl-CoA synthetase (AMP-forming)/AMP-acid ligase II [Thermomonospora echinospora]|uniref:Acyl-CoA synthetase (AMP-forming)/AMP-acid ligase II n=1 Tax=Thermomonospora echinospora TaxID=1992 RepID=A0A1H5T5P4_9ACTN|nr:fatty acid--CoA ligase family protein [Thermomonospora echinospora]SEF57317.1 Acyl-CoA synthetase (AMP-forming)/AMP-acid ligase II [Thermomonospora echinospora]
MTHGLADFLTGHPAAPDTAVLHWKDGELSLGELTAAARALAARLGPLDRAPVACLVDGGASAVTAMFATWLAGGVYVPVNCRLSDAEVRDQLNATAPAAVVVGAAHTDRVPGHLNRLVEHAPRSWIPVPATATWTGERYGHDAALVIRTSGTTGTAKPVILEHEGVREGLDTVIARLRGGSQGRPARAPMPNLIPTSMALWAGIWNALFAFRLGAPVVLLDRFDTADYADLVKRFGIRSCILAPAMMNMLAEDPRITDLAPLRLVRSITAPLTPAQARRFRDRFGVAILNSYGQTELGGEVAGWTAADVGEFGDAKLGAVGRPHPGVTVRIMDDERRELPAGRVGEIWIRSPFATRDVPADRVADGFLRTGDLGRLDDDGFLWIEGRVSDMINRGGMKIVPHEVEEALRRHPGVADACVAGVPDARLGEVPVAWVRPAAGQDPQEAELRAFARRALAGYKVPVAVRRVDDFPRNEIGKVLRRELVAGYEHETGTLSPDGTDSP